MHLPVSMFVHTVTVYYTGDEDPVTFETETVITVLRGVLLDAAKAVNVRQSGLESADAVDLYIPFGVDARDGVTGEAKTFALPKVFEAASDRSGLWTLSTQRCFFVKGEVVVPGASYQDINSQYDDVYRITSVDCKDFGRLKHWEVGGR